MTSATVRPQEDRWLRAIGYGFLAEAATVVTIIAIVTAYRYVIAGGLADADYAAFGIRTGEIVGIVGGAFYTFLFARLLTKLLSARFIEHGTVVAVAAVVFSVTGSIAGHHGLPAGYAIASALKLAGGALAGFLASKRHAPAISD